MSGFLKRGSSENSGFTLAELLIAMVISAIVFAGMMFTYVEGVKYTRESSNMMTLYSEGKTALEQMGWWIRQAARIRISSYGGVSNAKMVLAYNDAWGGGEAEFYFSRAAKELKWSDRSEGKRMLHMTLLPMLNADTEPNQVPYLRVKDCRFTPLDHIGAISPYLEGYWLIKIEMVLEDDQEDTLYLSSVYSRRNKFQ